MAASYLRNMFRYTWYNRNNTNELCGFGRSYGSFPGGLSDTLRVLHKSVKSHLLNVIHAMPDQDVKKFLARAESEDRGEYYDVLPPGNEEELEELLKESRERYNIQKNLKNALPESNPEEIAKLVPPMSHADRKEKKQDKKKPLENTKLTAAGLVKRGRAIQQLLRNLHMPQNVELDEAIDSLANTTAGFGLLNFAIIEPFNRIFRFPDPVNGKPTGSINVLAFFWPPKWYDFFMGILNGVCDFIGSRGGKGVAEGGFQIEHDWKSRSAQTVSFIIRLPIMLVQNILNFIFHPFDSLFGPFYTAISLWKDKKISGWRAAFICAMQLLKLALIAFAVASIFGAPFAGAIISVFNAIPGVSAIASAFSSVVSPVTTAVFGNGFGLVPLVSSISSTAGASVAAAFAPLASVAAVATSPTFFTASIAVEITSVNTLSDPTMITKQGLSHYRPGPNFGKIWGTESEDRYDVPQAQPQPQSLAVPYVAPKASLRSKDTPSAKDEKGEDVQPLLEEEQKLRARNPTGHISPDT